MGDDLRGWLQKAESIGRLRRIDGADWNLEIGTITALNLLKPNCPTILFDNIKDYPKGYRVVTCTGSTPSLVALTLNLPVTDSDLELVKTLRKKIPSGKRVSINLNLKSLAKVRYWKTSYREMLLIFLNFRYQNTTRWMGVAMLGQDTPSSPETRKQGISI